MVELREFLRVVRYRALVIVLLTAVGIGIGAAWLARSPSQYVATTRIFISGASAASQYDAQQGGVYAQNRVVSYERLVNSRTLAQRTIDALGLKLDAGTLAEHITSTTIPDAAVMDVSVSAESPEQAKDIANGLATQFIGLATTLETPPDSAAPVVRLTVVDPAEDGVASRILSDKLVYLFSALLGFFVGLILAFVLERYAGRVRDSAELQQLTGEGPAAELPASRTRLLPISSSDAGEAMRRLRVNIANNSPSDSCTIAFASLPGKSANSGRRFTGEAAVNFTGSLAAEKRSAVLLVLDPDPEVASHITQYTKSTRTKNDPHLAAQFGFDEPMDNYSLLDRSKVADQLRKLHAKYDAVIVVLPPLSEFAQAAVVAPLVDGVVAVGVYGETRRGDVEEHMAQIDRVAATSLGYAVVRRQLTRRDDQRTTSQPTSFMVRSVGAQTGSARQQSGPVLSAWSTAVSLNHR